jgi:YgiT-type zinc finger domain-containing protein
MTTRHSHPPTDLCALCGGPCAPGKTTSTTDFGDTLIVVRNVPAWVCQQCGEAWVESSAAVAVDGIVADARARKVAVEIVTMAA